MKKFLILTTLTVLVCVGLAACSNKKEEYTPSVVTPTPVITVKPQETPMATNTPTTSVEPDATETPITSVEPDETDDPDSTQEPVTSPS